MHMQTLAALLLIRIMCTCFVRLSLQFAMAESYISSVAFFSHAVLTVEQGIYMIMGANVGTSVTNTIVALGQIKDRDQFELAFAGATVHDMFNLLTVLVLLPIEAATGYLRALTDALVKSWDLETDKSKKQDLLKKLTNPLTKRIVQIDKKPIEKIAKGELAVSEARLLKATCDTEEIIANCTEVITPTYSTTNMTNVTTTVTTTSSTIVTTFGNNLTDMDSGTEPTINMNCTEELKIPCDYLFHNTSLSESAVGAILLVCSLVVLCVSLVFMVKILTRLLHGRVAESVKGFVNAEFPGKAAYFTGYLAILIGAGLTILVQSSSVFTSAITPLVGIGIIDLERMYPLTLGANVGTTVTGVLAGLASSNIIPAMRVSSRLSIHLLLYSFVRLRQFLVFVSNSRFLVLKVEGTRFRCNQSQDLPAHAIIIHRLMTMKKNDYFLSAEVFSRPPYIMHMLYTYMKHIFSHSVWFLTSHLQAALPPPPLLSPCSCHPAFTVLISV